MKARRSSVTVFPIALAAALAAFGEPGASAQTVVGRVVATTGAGQAMIPESSIEQPGDAGRRAHTNVGWFNPAGSPVNLAPPALWNAAQPNLPPLSGFFFETPASLGCVYKLVAKPVAGCNPNTVTANPTGGARVIAIVDAFHDASAFADLQTFSTQFGLPAPTNATFHVVFASGSQPPVDAGWNLEEALDVEWAHAMAPKAVIYLVEAASNQNTDLLKAVDKASALVAAAGGGEVSMSWGESEFSSEKTFDGHFKKPRVVYFASTGDSPGTEWPSVSPFIVSVGGTGISRNATTGRFQTEVAWQLAGGGLSSLYARPSYQNSVQGVTGTHRGAPDVAADSDSASSVWVFQSSSFGGWLPVFGTSVASPVWAAIVNSAGHFAASSTAELATIYANKAKTTDYRDIRIGSCAPYESELSVAGYDLCTGVGSPIGKLGK